MFASASFLGSELFFLVLLEAGGEEAVPVLYGHDSFLQVVDLQNQFFLQGFERLVFCFFSQDRLLLVQDCLVHLDYPSLKANYLRALVLHLLFQVSQLGPLCLLELLKLQGESLRFFLKFIDLFLISLDASFVCLFHVFLLSLYLDVLFCRPPQFNVEVIDFFILLLEKVRIWFN